MESRVRLFAIMASGAVSGAASSKPATPPAMPFSGPPPNRPRAPLRHTKQRERSYNIETLRQAVRSVMRSRREDKVISARKAAVDIGFPSMRSTIGRIVKKAIELPTAKEQDEFIDEYEFPEKGNPDYVLRSMFEVVQCRLPHYPRQRVDELVPVDLGSAHGGRALRARLEEAAEDLVQRRQRRRAHHGGRGALHRGRLSFGRHRCDYM